MSSSQNLILNRFPNQTKIEELIRFQRHWLLKQLSSNSCHCTNQRQCCVSISICSKQNSMLSPAYRRRGHVINNLSYLHLHELRKLYSSNADSRVMYVCVYSVSITRHRINMRLSTLHISLASLQVYQLSSHVANLVNSINKISNQSSLFKYLPDCVRRVLLSSILFLQFQAKNEISINTYIVWKLFLIHCRESPVFPISFPGFPFSFSRQTTTLFSILLMVCHSTVSKYSSSTIYLVRFLIIYTIATTIPLVSGLQTQTIPVFF